jgi:hypothetical protein
MMAVVDLQQHEYRRKGAWIIRHFNVDALKWWVTVAGVGGTVAAIVLMTISPAFGWLALAVMFGPGVTIIVMYAALEGTRKQLADLQRSRSADLEPRPESGHAFPREGTVAVASRAALPKSGSDPKNSRSP